MQLFCNNPKFLLSLFDQFNTWVFANTLNLPIQQRHYAARGAETTHFIF